MFTGLKGFNYFTRCETSKIIKKEKKRNKISIFIQIFINLRITFFTICVYKDIKKMYFYMLMRGRYHFAL